MSGNNAANRGGPMTHSKTCIGKVSRKPLCSYPSLAAAEDGARYVHRRWEKDMVPYRCDRCRKWHLSPTSRQTPSEPCSWCTGSSGQPKQSYRRVEHAQRRATILRDEHGVSLRVYACEHGYGYHLTSDVGGHRW